MKSLDVVIYISSIKAHRGVVRTGREGAREKIGSLRWWSRKRRRRERMHVMKNKRRSRRGTEAVVAEVI